LTSSKSIYIYIATHQKKKKKINDLILSPCTNFAIIYLFILD